METKVTLTGFNLGQSYSFKVKSRNSHGFSELSEAFVILAAKTPEQPAPPVTSYDGSNVIVDWEAPESNGSPILGYTIYLRQ